MRRLDPLPCAILLALLACAPEPPADSGAGPRDASAAHAGLPRGWILEAASSLDSLSGRIRTDRGLRIEVDIGPFASAFRRPDSARCAWFEEGSAPDYYAWRRSDEPETVHLLVRNSHPEGGAFWFAWRSADQEASRATLRQLRDARNLIRQSLLDLRK